MWVKQSIHSFSNVIDKNFNTDITIDSKIDREKRRNGNYSCVLYDKASKKK